MNKILGLIAFLLLFLLPNLTAQPITIGEKFNLKSKVLKMERTYNVYLPTSYHSSSDKTKFPVIYVIDGDYNFHYLTGLIEQLSNIGSKIPEMIVVGIADAGQTDYISNCTPYDKESNPTGQSEKFLKFIKTELQPEIDSTYKTADFDILIGHSLGGLFTVNALMTKPESFDAYIAISASLWWNDYKAEKSVEEFYKKQNNINRFLYLSVGDEVGMGVSGFYNQLLVQTFTNEYMKNKPMNLDFTFKMYPDESHGSVGWITVNDALRLLFYNYDIPHKALSKIETFEEYEKKLAPTITQLGDGFRFCESQIRSLVGMFYDKNQGELLKMETIIKEKYPASLGDFYNHLGKNHIKKGDKTKGIEILKNNCQLHPNSTEFLTSLGDAYFDNKNLEKAKTTYQKALALGIEKNARNWYLNQLRANIQKTEK